MRARRDTKRKRPTIFLHIVSEMNTGTVSKATVNESCQRHDAAHTGLSERIGSISNWANFPSAQLLYDSILFWTPCTCSLRPSAWFQTRQRWRYAAPSSARRWTPAGQWAAVVWSARLLSAWPLQLPVDREQVWGENSHVCLHCFWTLSV